MDNNETRNEKTQSLGEEIGKTYVYSAAATAGLLTGVIAVLAAKDRIDTVRENRRVKKAAKKAS